MSSVEVRGLQKSFDGDAALAGLDLRVEHGSITAILGPSGCGKSTLLRLVAGFLSPDAGEIRVADRVVATPDEVLPARRRRIGLVPQEGALFPHLDVAANIGFGLPRAERSQGRVEELLDLLELPRAFARRRPSELSGGQQQRVAVARALAPKPSVILLDEPFSSLDAALRTSTGQAVVTAIRASGATAILVTHDQQEALSLADHVAVMRSGRILQTGTPDEIYARPAHPFVATFVGDGSLLPATVVGGKAETPFGPIAVDSPDGEAVVFVRPEHVVLTPGAGDAEVTAIEFRGHESIVTVRQGDHHVVGRLAVNRTLGVGSRYGVGLDGPVRVFAP